MNVSNYNMVNLLPDWPILSTGKARRKISSQPRATQECISLNRWIVLPLPIIQGFYLPCLYVISIIKGYITCFLKLNRHNKTGSQARSTMQWLF